MNAFWNEPLGKQRKHFQTLLEPNNKETTNAQIDIFTGVVASPQKSRVAIIQEKGVFFI